MQPWLQAPMPEVSSNEPPRLVPRALWAVRRHLRPRTRADVPVPPGRPGAALHGHRRRLVPRRRRRERHLDLRLPPAALQARPTGGRRLRQRSARAASTRPRHRRLRPRRLRRPRRHPPLGCALVRAQGPSLHPAARRPRDHAHPPVRAPRPQRARTGGALRARDVSTDRGHDPAHLRRVRPARAQQPTGRRTMARDGVRDTPPPPPPPPSRHDAEELRHDPDNLGSALRTPRRPRRTPLRAHGRARRDRQLPPSLPGRLPSTRPGGPRPKRQTRHPSGVSGCWARRQRAGGGP